MDIIKNIYDKFESSLSVTLRVSMVITVTIVLLIALYNAVVGYVNSNAEATLETSVTGLDYRDAEELLFAQQEQVVIEEEAEESEEEEVVVDPRIMQIHKSISLHFDDRKPNTEQFKDEERGLQAKTLEGIVAYYGSGSYRLGTFADGQNPRKTFDFPKNEISGCKQGTSMPQLNGDQQNQLVSQLISFWKRAEQGTDEKKSKFMQIRDFDARMAQVYAANDLFLCEFANSYYSLSDKNRKLKAEANATSMEGGLMIAAAATIMNVMFKFFAAFALVLLTLILYRIERSLRK
jgi:hypothetical protein